MKQMHWHQSQLRTLKGTLPRLPGSVMHANVARRSIDPGVFREIDADTSNMITFLELEDE